MADESIWKKELSFKRKPKEQKEDEPAAESAADAQPTSLWKKELSLKRKPKSERRDEVDAVAEAAVAPAEPDVPASAEPDVAEVHASVLEPEPPATADEATWKKEASFGRKTDAVADEAVVAGPAEAAAAEPAGEDAVAEERPVTEEVPVSEPLALDESPTPSSEVDAVVESAPDETMWKREVSFSRKVEPAPEAEPAPPVTEPGPPLTVHAVEPRLEESTPAAEPAVEPIAAAPAVSAPPVQEEPWNAPPALPPVPAEPAQPVVPPPAAGVHAPVPASELPPRAEEKAKVPFWKKEISLGGKREKAPKKPKEPKERKRKAPKAEREPKAKEPKQPRRSKQPKEPKQKGPKMRAERGSKGAKRIVGLKIGASQLAAAKVANNGTAELQQVARETLAPGIVVGGELRDPDALAAALKEFFTKHGLPKRGIRLGIANNRIGVRTFEISGIQDPKQLGNAIRFRAQEALPIPIDEAVLDYQVLGQGVGEDGQPTQRILLVVAYRELIDRYVDACKKAGLVLSGIDLEAFALLRALQAPQDGVGADPSAALVAVAIGHERTTFAVSDGRVCEFTRVLEWGGSALNVAIARAIDAAPSEVEGAKRALALTDEMVPEGLTADQAQKAREAMRRAIQTFARELVSSLQYYQNQPGSLGIGEIVLTGGTAHLPGISGELERLIGVRVRVGDPLARMKVSKKVGEPEQLGSLAVAIGLGIED